VLLDQDECWARLRRTPHGVLATSHPGRGVDAVPVVYAVLDGLIVVPIDDVKPKRHLRLGRLSNLQRDPRCVLLVDEYRQDWSKLWWVRVHATGISAPDPLVWGSALASRFPAYRRPGAIVGAVVLTPTAVTGWSSAEPSDEGRDSGR
jgi:hypothetical protein